MDLDATLPTANAKGMISALQLYLEDYHD